MLKLPIRYRTVPNIISHLITKYRNITFQFFLVFVLGYLLTNDLYQLPSKMSCNLLLTSMLLSTVNGFSPTLNLSPQMVSTTSLAGESLGRRQAFEKLLVGSLICGSVLTGKSANALDMDAFMNAEVRWYHEWKLNKKEALWMFIVSHV